MAEHLAGQMDERDLYGTNRRRGSIVPILLGLVLAFLLGGAIMAVAVRRFQPVARLVHPAVAAVATPVVVPQRVAVAPPPRLPAASDPALADRVATVENRLGAIEQRAAAASGDADRAEAMLVAFAARRAIDRGQPLGFLEGMLRERFGATDAPAVALVIASAQRPVTLAQLEDGFAALAPSLVEVQPEESWWTGVRRELGSLFVIRRADTPSSIPDDRLARARHALDQGQVDVAMAEVARLPGAARANGWMASARRYVVAHDALDRLDTTALLKPAAPVTPLAAPAADTP